MKEKTVVYLSEKEEEFVNLLVQIGTQKNVAKVLIFLANAKKATSRMIERGIDLRQPEVSIAISHMKRWGWVKVREIPNPDRGRPNKEYCLAVPLSRILAMMEKATRERVDRELRVVNRIRSFA